MEAGNWKLETRTSAWRLVILLAILLGLHAAYCLLPTAYAQYAPTPSSRLGILKSVWDPVNGALRVEFSLGSNPNAGAQPTSEFAVFKAAYDPVNGALFINCVSGCGNATTLGVNRMPVVGWPNMVVVTPLMSLVQGGTNAALLPACSALRRTNCTTKTIN